MPYINIKITREGTTAEQKAELIKGATELLARVLNKNPKTTVVTIEEVDTDSWGIGGDPVEIAREKEKLRVAEIEKLKLSKDALVRELAELKGIPLALAADEPPVFTLDNNALKLKKGKKLKRKGYRTFCVDFNTDEVRHCLASSVFYPFPKKIKGGQNELVKNPKMIAMTALIRVISF